MPVSLNHTIVRVKDKRASAEYYADVLGLAPPRPFGPFLVSEAEFDQILGRIQRYGTTYYADPGAERANEWNIHDGGRGLYWADPDGHWLEIITRPYGGA